MGFPPGVTAGTHDHTFDTALTATLNPTFLAANGGTTPGAEAAFLNALLAEKAYIDIHTTFAPRARSATSTCRRRNRGPER